MVDIRIAPYAFAATTTAVEPLTPRGVELFADIFGRGAVAVEMPISQIGAFAEHCRARGAEVR